MDVCELFTSIQGESTLQGLPTLFIRLAGCNLDCRWCDTAYARSGGLDMAEEDVRAAIAGTGAGAVCITGGEPLLQPAAVAEISAFCLEHGLTVSLETNGSLDVSAILPGVRRIIDVKCPSSGEAGSTHPANFINIRPEDEFKFVIADRDDFIYARTIATQHDLFTQSTVLVSPVSGSLAPHTLAEWLLSDMSGARLNLQLHRIIWPASQRGR